MILIELSPDEVMHAAMVAVHRRVWNMREGLKPRPGIKPELAWSVDIEGACAECAFAKWRDYYWNGNIGNLRAADVGEYEVRSTPHHNGHLLVRPTDPDERVAVLMTGCAPKFVIRGWLRCGHGKQEKFWRDDAMGQLWWVPQSCLISMNVRPDV
jgi:hypothetical protein